MRSMTVVLTGLHAEGWVVLRHEESIHFAVAHVLGTCVEIRRMAEEWNGFRGLFPAALGNFVSHGVRTFSYEASFSALSALTHGAAELQVRP